MIIRIVWFIEVFYMSLMVGDRVEHNTFPVFIGKVAYIESNIDKDRVGVVNEDNGSIFWDTVDTWDVLYDSKISYTSQIDEYDGDTIDVDAVIDIGSFEGWYILYIVIANIRYNVIKCFLSYL